MAKKPPHFSKATIEFIEKSQRARRPDWLDRNREEYERVLLEPLRHFARSLKAKLSPLAPGYHFPLKGIGRMRRSAHRAQEYGSLFRDYVSYNVTTPSKSRFDHNPNLYFLVYPADEDGEQVLVAGGLYVPSSRQTRAIREAIAADASAFDRLFASKAFAARFPGGFSDERKSSRVPRGFDPRHPRLDWIQLQAFFVWRPYSRKEFSSPGFVDTVAADWAQILRLNELLLLALEGRLPKAEPKVEGRAKGLSSRLDEIERAPAREMDF